jgi:hypothetical protein
MIAFIDANKRRWGVEPICRVLPIAPSTYHAAKTRPLPRRAVRDVELAGHIRRVHAEHYGVYEDLWDGWTRTSDLLHVSHRPPSACYPAFPQVTAERNPHSYQVQGPRRRRRRRLAGCASPPDEVGRAPPVQQVAQRERRGQLPPSPSDDGRPQPTST